MFKNTQIKKLTAGLLLLLFGLSITPKIVMHDWLASHKDSLAKFPGNSPHISHPKFNCNCDNIVAESPFTQQDNSYKLTVFQPISVVKDSKPVFLFSTSCFLYTLRGPPAFC